MDKITSKDIEAIREYRDKLEALNRETPPAKLTPEEWDEAMEEITRTGKIPAKYNGRIAENEVTVYSDIVDGKHKQFPEGIRKKAYYDVADEAHNAKYSRLEKEYHDSIIKALQAYFERTKDKKTDETQGTGIAAIITELLEDPVIRRELEKEAAAGQLTTLAPLGSIPNGDSLNWLFRVISASKGGRIVQANPANRHEVVKAEQYGDKVRFTRTNKQNGTTAIVEIDQADKYLSKTNKTFTKVLLFMLQKMTAQNFPLEVGFSLQELVDLGMYSTTSNASRAVKEFFEQQKLTTISGIVKKGRKTVKEEGGILFYHYSVPINGFMKLSVNPNFNMEFIANYFTIFPRFAYALSNNAFSLVRYIFFLARQNTQAIKAKGTFTISLEAVRENLGLPSVDDVKNRKYRQFIIEPIEKAIEETEEALQTVPEAKEYGFTITPHGTDTSNINEWLQGYLEIGLKGDFAETFVRLATKAEKDRVQWEKVKQAELARIAARAEAKEAQEEPPKRTRGRRKKT